MTMISSYVEPAPYLTESEEAWESEAQDTFDYRDVPAAVVTRLKAGRESDAVGEAIRAADRSENHLTDLVFFWRHPERFADRARMTGGRFLVRTEPNYRQLAQEWVAIRDTIVRPALTGAPVKGQPSRTPDRTAAGIQRPQDVRYLALEGGGGKGVTYLGAVKALENLGVLPIDLSRPGQNQLKGIAGSSAGAISALMLALGLNAAEVQQILSNPQTFASFLDGPDTGRFRAVNRNNQPDVHVNSSWSQTACVVGSQVLSGMVTTAFLGALFGSLANVILGQRERYFCNLLFDGGFCPGFAARRFLANLISQRLAAQLAPITARTGGAIQGANLGFALFHQLTGVDLIVTGTNVTKGRPAYFSRYHTPLFPVAEAVGISMSIPPAFKPVWVDANVVVGPLHRSADDYQGLWLDGGMLNNLPMHAFDYVGDNGLTGLGTVRPLHPGVLALRLSEGNCARRRCPVAPAAPSTAFVPYFLSALPNTLLYPSEQGQIRTPAEAAQTIDLDTCCLKTLDFAPAESERAEPIALAEQAVLNYFRDSAR